MVKAAVVAAMVAVVVGGAVVGATVIADGRAGWLVSPGPMSRSHAHLADRCAACHTPYQRIRGTACVRCHALADRLLAEERSRFHGFVPSCVECHREHDGGLRPTSMDHAALERLLRERLGDAVAGESLACEGCHRVEEPHGGTLGAGCDACHRDSTWQVAGFTHPSPRARDCGRCHREPPSHRMEHFQMSQRWAGVETVVERCWACHQTTAWNDILDRGWIDHH